MLGEPTTCVAPPSHVFRRMERLRSTSFFLLFIKLHQKVYALSSKLRDQKASAAHTATCHA
ncbi:lysine-specific demethylase 2A-like [Gossypium australe]|uniref:Lysine-specific demethylase 2A-like n=1 Tax=Gossypium australe TaxID=47621 RepID=A0A5B6VH36_9ROSI|nr:lysine-specific demethylase 2A-like [Gossypium australe]